MRDRILHLLLSRDDLPPLPEVLIKLENKISDPNCDHEAIKQLVETDPVLSGRLIVLANSVLIGGGRDKAQDLSGALVRLGLDMVQELAYTLQLPALFKREVGFNQLQFWKHSFFVALVSEFLARKLNFSKKEIRMSYFAGLMHDLGILVFCDLIAAEYREFTKSVKCSGESLEVLEKEKFGIGHPELGARFIEKWPIDPKVAHAAEWHHRRVKEDKLPTNVRQVVSLANRIANSSGCFHGITDSHALPIASTMVEMLEMTAEEFDESLDNMLEIVGQSEALLTG